MQWFRRSAAVAVLLVVSIAVVIFVLENQGVVQLAFLGLQSPQWPLAVYIVAAFILGGFLGLVIQLPFLTMSRVRVSSMRTELAQARKEVDALRAAPSKVS
ncbi:LapA family protein [Pseudomonas aeruginosa]|uniref:lipopolysaccharide assembly protein LapA domain-containing protein n=1 Tax=Pseudomonas aeruginosa TaxID=287 RepID=UPI000EAB5CD3|nr:LapA family protein [Pseudomonas aeruginosa]MCO2235487.1 LapA family protein [Pseudomonas aeruginosa]MCO2240801.1 LapA family protein [Pseudomonas aeruginosa]MCO2337043.1 LapA family protein [Pseudomonas aeruginosa]MCO2359413.1 LapA family protein [Pseudomonas aeruginosa]MCO2968947.1 LapA family protein [Pseudomonas aeruginosa]